MTIKDARLAKNWTQHKLALALQVQTTVISRWESGRCEPSPVYRRELARVLGGKPDDYKKGSDNAKEQ